MSVNFKSALELWHFTIKGMDAFTLDPTRVRDIPDLVLDARESLHILPARKLAATAS